jgi:hypothetical protein
MSKTNGPSRRLLAALNKLIAVISAETSKGVRKKVPQKVRKKDLTATKQAGPDPLRHIEAIAKKAARGGAPAPDGFPSMTPNAIRHRKRKADPANGDRKSKPQLLP